MQRKISRNLLPTQTNIENLQDAAFSKLLEDTKKQLEEISKRIDNQPSLLELAQENGDRELLNVYFKVAETYFKLFRGSFTTVFDSELYQRTILNWAIACLQEADTLEELISQGSRPDETYYDDNFSLISAFTIALHLNNLDAVRTLLKHHPALAIQNFNEWGSMPAHYAAQHDLIDILDELHKANEDITHIPAGPRDLAPLHTAAMFGRTHSATWILEHDPATCNLPDVSGFTALHFAVLHDHPAMASLLLKKGADMNLVTKPNSKQQARTALQLAADKGNNEMVRLLMKHTEKLDDNKTPNYASLIEHLHKAPVDPSRLNENLRTAFALLDYINESEKNPQYRHAVGGYNLNPLFAWPKDIKTRAAKKVVENVLNNETDPFSKLTTEEYGALKDKYGRLRTIVLPLLEKYRPGSNRASPVTPNKLSPQLR